MSVNEAFELQEEKPKGPYGSVSNDLNEDPELVSH